MTSDHPEAEPPSGVQAAARRALELVTDGAKIGLGTGRAASAFIDALGARARAGLAVAAVASSERSARRARALGIPLIELGDETELDLTVDGADEVAPNLDLVKGRGGALVRERIVAANSRRQVILVGPEKLVGALGERGMLPVEIVSMARGLVLRRLRALGLRPALRRAPGGAGAFVTDNGNVILDSALGTTLDGPAARDLARAIREIPGVVDMGLFLGTAERVLVGYPDGRVDVLMSPGGSERR